MSAGGLLVGFEEKNYKNYFKFFPHTHKAEAVHVIGSFDTFLKITLL